MSASKSGKGETIQDMYLYFCTIYYVYMLHLLIPLCTLSGVASSGSLLNISQTSSSSAGSIHTQPEGVVTSTPLVGTGGRVNPNEDMELSTIPASSTSSKAASSRAKKVSKLGTPVVTSLAARLDDHPEKQRYMYDTRPYSNVAC